MTIVFRQLIDAAIGSPDPGHVDFYALQCVLYHFADKLNLLDCVVDNTKFRSLFCIKKKGTKRSSKCHITSAPSRLFAGADDVNAEVAAVPEEEPQVAEQQPVMEEATANEIEVVEVEPAAPEVEENVENPPVPEEEPKPAGIEEVIAETTVEPIRESAVTSQAVRQTLPETLSEPQIEAEVRAQSQIQPSYVELERASDAKPEIIRSEAHLESIKSPDGKIQYIYEPISEELLMGISIMKDQIELAMEQINMLINLEITGKRKSLVPTLKDLNKKMRKIQRANFYIESKSKSLEQEYVSDESLQEGIEGLEEIEEEEIEVATAKVVSKVEQEVIAEPTPLVQPTLEYHLCYSPERIMDELLELKSEFCNLTNKFNDMMVALEEIDSQRAKVILSELQDQMREVRYIITVLKDGQEFLNSKEKINIEKIIDLEKSVNGLRINKVEKTDMELALAEKVDFELLERKVSHDQLKEALCRVEKEFCEMQRLINFNEKHALQVIENMRKNLGLDKIDQMLKDFRDKVDKDIEKLQEILQNYIDSTSDECAAAGARVQVLKNLACISCDTKCVMRTMEKAKVGKLRNAHVTPGLGPLITYELGSIRKSGLMGYFRKDEFPHAPNAWMNRKNVALSMCLPRHAGGKHTTHTAKELVDKVVKRIKQ